MKKFKVVEFVKTHKKEIIITTLAGAIGLAIGYKPYAAVKRNHGDLIKAVSEFKGTGLEKELVEFLNNATGTVQPVIYDGKETMASICGEELFSQLSELGHEATDKVSSVLIGTMK